MTPETGYLLILFGIMFVATPILVGLFGDEPEDDKP